MKHDEDDRPPLSSDSAAAVPLDEIPLHSANLLTVLDENGVIRYESPSIERIFGYEQHELVGDQVAEYFHPEDRDRVVRAFRRVVESDTNIVESVEYRHERVDGEYCWTESVASSNPTPAGLYVVNSRDISDRKSREHELQRINSQLEEFATIVSHDLRNPLSVAAGHLELARDECESDHLDDVEQAHDRIDEIINGVLQLARIGEIAGDTEPVSVADIAEPSWQSIASEEAVLVIDTDDVIETDAAAFRHLLEYLFRNAIKHGGTDIVVTVGGLEDGFYVEDNGPGIPQDDRAAVIEPGYSTDPDGTGFGLSIVEDIASAHGWDFIITASSDGGARFEFSGVDPNPGEH